MYLYFVHDLFTNIGDAQLTIDDHEKPVYVVRVSPCTHGQ